MLERVKTAVLVSGGGTNLAALIAAGERGEMPSCELALCLSDRPDANALRRAEEAGIPTAVADYKSSEDFDREVLDVLRTHDIEFVVHAGFLRVMGPAFCEAYAGRCINVHPALLPNFGGRGMYGLHVHRAVLDAGIKTTGATVHYVSEVCDGGEIIAQKTVAVLPDDTPETLQKRVMEQAEWVLLPKMTENCCKRILRGRS